MATSSPEPSPALAANLATHLGAENCLLEWRGPVGVRTVAVMISARCTLDGRDYDAFVFSRLPRAELEERRRALICLGTGCGGRAFYRRKAVDGRAPCFGSNEHIPGCDRATAGPPDAGGGFGVDVDEFANLGNRLHIDTRPTAQAPHHDPDTTPETGRLTPHHRGHGPDGPRTAVSHRRLRPILRELLRSPAFAQSDRIVHYEDFPPAPTSEFFRPLVDVDTRDERRRRGYWGTVVSAYTSGDGTLWLNVGPPGMCSVLVPAATVTDFLRWTGEHEADDLPGGAIIVLGRCELSQGGKLYVRVKDLAACAWAPFRP